MGLLSCSNPTPIPVYVTPTPVVQVTTTVPAAEPSTLTRTDTPAPTGTPTIIPEMSATPSPTSQPGGVTYGPITGPDYTPLPRYTPLPSTVHVRPCPVVVTAPQVSLYTAPDKTSQVTGTALEMTRLTAGEIRVLEDGTTWVNTPNGWLTATDQGVELAKVGPMRSCEILMGRQTDTTLMGLHVTNIGSRDAVLELVRRLVDSGHPLGTLKGLNGTESLLNEVKAISPQTIIVYRALAILPDGLFDCPDLSALPPAVDTAQMWMDMIKPQWDLVNADYYEYMNECGAPMNWIAQFSIEMMRLANEQGRCLLLFSFPNGSPNMNYFDDLLPAYQYAVDHPCQPGRTHGIALHAYSPNDNTLLSESDVWIAFRHRIMYLRLLDVLPEAADLPVFYTEAGVGYGITLLPCDTVARDVVQYTYQLEEDPYFKGFHLWNIGGERNWVDYTACLGTIGDQLIAYYSQN
jgi:hypothetical protein